MTYEEQNEYNQLPLSSRQDYDYIKSKHPNWSHQQIMIKVSFEPTISDFVTKGGNVTPTSGVLQQIFEGAKRFLKQYNIYIKEVFDYIDNALEALGDLIANGISYIGEKLGNLFDWLFE